MLIKPKNILAIEISPHRVNIIEGIRSARQPKIINYIQIPAPPQEPDLLAQKISAALKEKGIKTKAAHLVIYSPQIEQRYIQVPNLSKKELEQVVKREAAKAKEKMACDLKLEGKESNSKFCAQYLDYQLLGEIEAQKVKKRGLILVTAPQGIIDEQAKLLQMAELEPQLITHSPLALANSLNFVSPAAKEGAAGRENTAFLYLMPDRAWLIIVSQGVWRFFRELRLKSSDSGDQAGGAEACILAVEAIDYQELVLEITRSFLYFNQQERGKQVSGLVLGSCWKMTDDTVRYFAERLQIPVSLFDPAEKLSFGGLTAPEGGWPLLLNSMPVVLGLLVESAFHISVNLLPLNVVTRKQSVAGKVLVGLGLTAYAALAGGGYMGLRWAEDNYRKALDSRKQSLQPLESSAKKNQAAEQERQIMDSQTAALKGLERMSPLWRGVFYELSRSTPSGLNFSAIGFNEAGGRWEFKLEGVIRTDTSMQAQDILKDFMKRLEESVFFSYPRIEGINISPYKPQGSRSDLSQAAAQVNKGGVAGKEQTQLSFVLAAGIRH